MLDLLLTRFEIVTILVLVLDSGDVVQIAHHAAAGSQALGRVVGHGELNDLLLVVLGLLRQFDGIITLTHCDGDQMLSHGLNFLATCESGFDLSVPDQIGDLIAKHRHSLVGRTAQLAMIGHCWFLP